MRGLSGEKKVKKEMDSQWLPEETKQMGSLRNIGEHLFVQW